jgi:hypothetical protein
MRAAKNKRRSIHADIKKIDARFYALYLCARKS